jgi:hypothetical protein
MVGWGPFGLFLRGKRNGSRRCGNVGNAERFPRAVGSGGKPQSVSDGDFPRLSTVRHFHSARCSRTATSGTELGDASQQLTLGALHVECGFGIGLMLGEVFELGQGDAGTEQALALRDFLE